MAGADKIAKAEIGGELCELVDGNRRWICKGSPEIQAVLNQELLEFLELDRDYHPDRLLAAAAYVIKVAGGKWLEIPVSQVIQQDDPDTVY